MIRSFFLIIMLLLSCDLLAQTWSGNSTYQIFSGTVGIGLTTAPSTSNKLIVSGQTLLENPSGRTLMIQRNDEDSWITFHDNDNMWYSMGIDYSDARKFKINYGGVVGEQTHFVMTNEGKLGIGTNTPRAHLDMGAIIHHGALGTVFGRQTEGNTSGDGTFLGVRGFETTVNGKSFSIEHAFYGITNSSINFHRGPDTKGGYLTFNTNDNMEQMRITSQGYVGIGTTSPDARLVVKGTIHTQEVRVDLQGAVAPDYVFEKAYTLRPLAEVEHYISENKHLPEIPSAKQMEEDGLNLKEMNLLLLKKVEELTLYVIELKKENEIQQKGIDAQQRKIDALENKE